MHPAIRPEPRLELLHREAMEHDDPSVGELVSRLAHEGSELVSLEIRRLRVEVRDQARRAARTAAAGYVAIELIALATLAGGVGLFFVLDDLWGNHAAAAFVTGGVLAVAALCCSLAVRSMTQKVFGAFADEAESLKRDGRAIRGE